MTDLSGYGCTDYGCDIPAPYVNVAPSGNVWITLPGDNESHLLAPGEARRLMRELEEVV